MNHTYALLAIGLLATAALAAAPTATADTAPECLAREGHDPTHCATDCTPLSDELIGIDGDTPLDCHED